eukprot:8630313-Pyramimonas_sp.AAC.1
MLPIRCTLQIIVLGFVLVDARRFDGVQAGVLAKEDRVIQYPRILYSKMSERHHFTCNVAELLLQKSTRPI